MTERVILGIEVRDWPTCIRTRLSECRTNGHHFARHDKDYCMNCGAPWLFLPVTDMPRRGPREVPK